MADITLNLTREHLALHAAHKRLLDITLRDFNASVRPSDLDAASCIIFRENDGEVMILKDRHSEVLGADGLMQQLNEQTALTDNMTISMQQLEAQVSDLTLMLDNAHAAIADETLRADSNRTSVRTWCALAEEREKQLGEQAKKITALKERLANAETSNQFMRGYLARVREDDIVREELLPVGDPDGEKHLVPKRKPTEFPRPSDYEKQESGGMGIDSEFFDRHLRDKKRAKHWITY